MRVINSETKKKTFPSTFTVGDVFDRLRRLQKQGWYYMTDSLRLNDEDDSLEVHVVRRTDAETGDCITMKEV